MSLPLFALAAGEGATIVIVNNSIAAAGEVIDASRLLYCSLAKLSVEVAKVLEFRDQIVEQGQFPEYEQFVFEQMGATEENI
jgi:hypothetical protein